MFALSSHSNHNNLNHQLKDCFGVCFQKRSCVLTRNVARKRSLTCKTPATPPSAGESMCGLGQLCSIVLCVCVFVRAHEHVHSVYLPDVVCVCLCMCTVRQAFGPYLHEVRVPWFLTLVRGARKTTNERLMSFIQPQLCYLGLC